MVEVPYVHDLRQHPVQKGLEGGVHGFVAVPVTRSSHVDDVECDSGVRGVVLLLNRVFGKEGVLLPGEDVHFVAFG